MPDNTPETQSILPVTAEDREAAWPHRPECYRGGGRTRENWDAGIYDHIPLLQAFARHRAFGRCKVPEGLLCIHEFLASSDRISHSLPGNDIVDEGYKGGYEFFRNKWIGDQEEMIADMVRCFVPREALTPSALSGDNSQSSSNAGGVDVEALRPLREITALSADPASKRILCLHFRREIGSEHREAILAAVNIAPRDDSAALASLSTPTAEPMAELQRLGQEYDGASAGHDDRLALRDRIQRARDSAGTHFTTLRNETADKVISALTTPPTPDRIGKDAVREALERVRAILEQGRDGQSKYRQARIVAALDEAARALSATPAQEGEGDA